MPIYDSTDNINFDTPDVFVQEQEPPATVQGASIGTVGTAVQAIRGPVGQAVLVSDLSDYIRKFGGYDASIKDDFMFMRNLFNSGSSAVKVVRVTDGTEETATCTASGSIFTLTSPGSYGNDVTLTSVASAVDGYVDLTFSYGSEIYTYAQVTFTDSNDGRYVDTVLDDAVDEFVELTTNGGSNPIGSFTFTGGTNGTDMGLALDDDDYVGTNSSGGLTGLVALEGEYDVEIVVLPRASTTINDGIKTHVELSTVSPRMGVIAPPSGSTVSTVVTLMTNHNTDRLVMCYPFLQVKNPYSKKKEYHIPTAFYAGVLSTLQYHISPSQQQIKGIIGTERQLTPAEVNTLSKNRVSSITVLPAGGFGIRNGLNTSANPAKANTTRRRAANYFARTFEVGSRPFVSKPHTVALRNDVKSAYGNLLNDEVSLGRIGNPNTGRAYAIKCDAQNNPDSVVRANKLIVDVQISLLSPADFILVRLDASEAKVLTIA